MERRDNKKRIEHAEGILSRSPVVAFVWENAEGWPVAYVSDNVHTIFGWNKDDFLENRVDYAQVVHPDDLPRVTDEVRRYSADKSAGKVLHGPYRIVARDESVKWVEDLTTILRNEDGSVAAYEGILLDITDRKQMEERLHLVQFSIDHAAEGISWLNRDGRIVYANETEYRRLGYTREEFLKLYSYDVDATLTPEKWPADWEEGLKRGARTFETLFRKKDGRILPVEVSINHIEYNGKEYSFAFSRDITEHKQAKEEQERLQSSLVNAVEVANLGPWEHDLVNDIFILNDHYYQVYHTTAEQVGGYILSTDECIRRFVHPDDMPLVMEEMRKTLAKPDSLSGHQFEHRFLYPDGEVGYAAVRISFVKDSSGKVIRAYGVTQDITERKLAERERLDNLKYFETMEKVNQAIQGGANDLGRIMENVLDVCLSVFQCDRVFLLYPCDPEAPFWSIPFERTRPEYPGGLPHGKTIPMNSDAARIFRINLSSQGATSFSPGSVHLPSKDFLEKHGFHSQMTIALHPKVGKPWQFGLHQCSHARDWTSEEEDLFEKIAQRLTDSLTSLLMHRDLRKNEKFLNSIVENIPDTIFVKDADKLRFVQINRAGEKLMGCSREKLIGKNSYDLSPEGYAKAFEEKERAVLRGKQLVDIPEEKIINTINETHVLHTKLIPLFDDAGKPEYLLGIAENITELRKLQAQLNQIQKMEALGAMSGGIAHDFNNLLQPIMGFCELLKADLSSDSPLQKFVDGIFKSGMRAKDLVNQILAFSRQTEHKIIPVDIQPILKETVKLCRSTIPSNIEITRDIQDDCAGVLADPTQIHQILMNLMVNAYHAMDASGGKISVRLKETVLGEDDLKDATIQPGRYAMISVADTGSGIAPEMLEKIFEPYFTTKAKGKGTGLGLAVVYGIVREHNGHLTVTSEVGKGTVFNIYLPISEKSSEAPAEEKTETFQTGDERILLVDDEETIIGLVTVILERFGYRVTACRNGTDALKIFGANPEAFDLVITDMAMPNMTGDELSKALLAIRPDLPIIICTGYSEKISVEEAKSLGVREFLLKPISVPEITQKVRKVLDEARC